MKPSARSAKSAAKQSARLGAYLATGIGASTVATSTVDAAVVNIDIGPTGFNMDGINAGVSNESIANFFEFPVGGGGGVTVWTLSQEKGLFGINGLKFAYTGGYASPRNFAINSEIDSSASFSGSPTNTFFTTYYYEPFNSPNFGPGSYMGFRTATNNYGWLEVTWDSKTSQFEILSGAYESTPGVSILAGATAVPEPSTSALFALFAGGATFTRWRKRRDAAA